MNIKQLKEYIKDLPDDMEVMSRRHMRPLEIDGSNIYEEGLYI